MNLIETFDELSKIVTDEERKVQTKNLSEAAKTNNTKYCVGIDDAHCLSINRNLEDCTLDMLKIYNTKERARYEGVRTVLDIINKMSVYSDDLINSNPLIYIYPIKTKTFVDYSNPVYSTDYAGDKEEFYESLETGILETREEKIIDAFILELRTKCGYNDKEIVDVCRKAGMTDEEINASVVDLPSMNS